MYVHLGFLEIYCGLDMFGGNGYNFNSLVGKFVVYKVQNDGHHGSHTISSFVEWSPCVATGMSGRDVF